jgi:ABC-type Fe3+-hydroxamate transport system substrate-binding protein
MNRLLLTLFISVLVSVPQALSDMKEDQATVQRVFGSSPPMNYLLYALDPDKMIGLNFKAKNPFNGADPAYLDRRFLELPVIGSFHGSGSRINLETLVAARPDLVLIWEDDMLVQTVTDQIKKLGVPTLTVPFCTWVMIGYFSSIPKELDEAALIDGASYLQMLVKIFIPVAMPGIIAATIMRIAFASITVQLLNIVGIVLAGGVPKRAEGA